MAQNTKPRVGVYVRISEDHEGIGAGVRRQEDDCRSYCARKGYDVADVYEDNDKSAYKPDDPSKAPTKRTRTAYRRMLADLEAGRIDGVICYNLDRLHRQPVELEHFFKVADKSGAILGTVTGDIDLATSDGQFHARIMGAVAKKASDDASRRLKRKWEETAKEGKTKGGGKRPYGYEADKVTIREAEAEVVREMARRVLAGEAVNAITNDLRARGVLSSGGNQWTIGQVRRTLVNPRYAGLRAYKGKVVHKDGEAVKGAWAPILSEKDHERLKTILLNPARRTNQTTSRRHLLSGFLFCGNCGNRLTAVHQKEGRLAYACRDNGAAKGCGKVSVAAEPVEKIVLERVVETLTNADPTESELDSPEAVTEVVTELASLQERGAQLDDAYYVLGNMPEDRYRSLRKGMDKRVEELERKLLESRMSVSLTDVPLTEAALRERWGTESLEWKRNLIANLIYTPIKVQPAKGRGRFDPERVSVLARERFKGVDGIKA